MRLYNGKKTMKDSIREYLIEHKEISVKTAKSMGWKRLIGCVFDFRQEGMNIVCEKRGNGNTVYKLVEDGMNIVEAEPQKEKQEIKLSAEDMVIKTTMGDVILDHLKKHKTITSAVAMKKYRCLNLSNIIARLKNEGWNITRSVTRKNNDFNVASNRNNAYTVYTLENKTRKKSVYKVDYICQAVVQDNTSIHATLNDAMKEIDKITDLMVEHLNLFYGNSIVEFIKVTGQDNIMVVKKETIKKLFRKKYNTNMLAKFSVNEEQIEV